MAEITDLLIKSKSGEYDLEMVRRLTISSLKLARIGGLDGCFRLVELSLSRNSIAEIEGLDNLPLLERLDLAWNAIRRVRGLAHLQALALVDLRGNRVADVDDALDGLTGCYRLVFRVWAGHRRRRNGLIDNFHDCRSAQPLSNEVSCTAASVPSVPICLVNDMNVVISQQPSQYATRSILLQQPLSATVQFASRRRQQTPPYLQWTRGFTYSTGYSFTTIVVDNYAKSRKTIWPNEFPPGSAFTGWEVSNQIATGRDCMTRPASTGVSSGVCARSTP